VLQKITISRICPIPELDIEPNHGEDLRPGLADIVKRLHLGDKVYNLYDLIFFRFSFWFLFLTPQEIRMAENFNNGQQVLHHIMHRINIIKWVAEYNTITSGRGTRVFRQQLLELLFQDTPAFRDRISSTNTTLQDIESAMDELKPQFRKWKKQYNAIHVTGRSLLYSSYQRVRCIFS